MAKRIQCSTGFFNWIFNGYALFYVKIFLKCDYVKKNRTGSYFWFSHHMGNLGAWTLFAVFGHPELKSWINNYRKWNCWPLKFDKTLQSYQFSKTGHHLVRLGYTSQKNVQNYWSDHLWESFQLFGQEVAALVHVNFRIRQKLFFLEFLVLLFNEMDIQEK